jgi:hypothetical protein
MIDFLDSAQLLTQNRTAQTRLCFSEIEKVIDMKIHEYFSNGNVALAMFVNGSGRNEHSL